MENHPSRNWKWNPELNVIVPFAILSSVTRKLIKYSPIFGKVAKNAPIDICRSATSTLKHI
jgi:hypothetical protein